MYITRIEQSKGNRYRVFGDDGFLFSLYGKELKEYHIKENTELEDAHIHFILQEIIYKRAKDRALFLLEGRPYSVAMLKQKLHDNEYPETVIDQVIAFLQKYHYLDDTEYIHMYVEAYSNKKSRKQLVYDLIRKGISKDMIDTYFEEFAYSEQNCFEKQFERYIRGRDLEDIAVKQKIFRYFYRKGFQPSLIEEALRR